MLNDAKLNIGNELDTYPKILHPLSFQNADAMRNAANVDLHKKSSSLAKL